MKTSEKEAKRVDGVKTPKLRWYTCHRYAQCATTRLPRDYDHPRGAQVEVSLLRVRARDQRHRIGSLFVNPGGPGASATDFALNAPFIFGPDILDRFDIAGFDPRGTNASEEVACFKSAEQQTPVLADLMPETFPYTTIEENKAVRGAQALGRACSSTGKPLSASMSTAEVARDMDVIRRSVGDRLLTYLGFSYGTYLGQVYANMFPDRFRALVIDGVINPVAWSGTKSTANVPVTDRIQAADGATRAFHELLVRCDRVGGSRCTFAPGDPVANFDLIARRLKKTPVDYVDPDTGEVFRFGYAELIAAVLNSLYDPLGYSDIEDNLSQLIITTEPPSKAKASLARRLTALRKLRANVQKARRRSDVPLTLASRRYGFPYDNSVDVFEAVLCTDSLNPVDASSWPAAADAADKRARYFGRLYAWASAPCARKTWTARDEDAYRGRFDTLTAAPVLVVGSLWDPATNYAGAVKAAALLPNSRLLTSDNWGHTAYGTSDCATSTIDEYLLQVRLPSKGKRCMGDVQPFETPPEGEGPSVVQRLLQPMVGPGRLPPTN